MEKKKKPIYRNGVFWLAVALILLMTILIIYKRRDEEKATKVWSKIGEIINEETKKNMDEENTKSHLHDFSYNYETGEVEYHPNITLELYDRIQEEMTQEEVVAILGKQENKLDGENTYMLEWGNSYSPITGGYWIQVVFDENERVLNKSQTGLK